MTYFGGQEWSSGLRVGSMVSQTSVESGGWQEQIPGCPASI